MRNIKLSKNFSLYEFTFSKISKKHAVLSNKDYQLLLLQKLVDNIMQLVRNKFGTVYINSGIRDKYVFDTLKKNGYNPSKTTDHSFGIPEVNQFGAGAADFVMSGANLWDVYNYIRATCIYGQVIIYLTGKLPTFIHVSNPTNLIYNQKLISDMKLDKEKNLVCVGKKYIIYDTYVEEKYRI